MHCLGEGSAAVNRVESENASELCTMSNVLTAAKNEMRYSRTDVMINAQHECAMKLAPTPGLKLS